MITAVRFPVMQGRGTAFNEMARRHGDFAIIAVAALIEDKGTARLGVGGMSGAPVVRRIALNGGAALKDAIETLAAELEGYEDLHASAELRRDILRNRLPVVIEEAVKCRKQGSDGQISRRSTAQGFRRGRTAHAISRHALARLACHVGCEHGVCGAAPC
jgi:hypothetical protein